MLTIWLAHVTFCTAYVAVVISSRLRELDHSIEEAAMDLGDAAEGLFHHYPADDHACGDLRLAAGVYPVSGRSGDRQLRVRPGATTLPMLVFSSVRMGVNPEINALASIILGVVGIVGFIAWYLMARAEKQRVRDIQRARRG
jgi:putrescine transport system permease protein